jgi:hypothetical protein
LPGQGGEQVYVTVALGANLCQIDAGIGDSAFRLTQFDPCIEAGLEPLLCDGKYLRPLLFGTLRNVRKSRTGRVECHGVGPGVSLPNERSLTPPKVQVPGEIDALAALPSFRSGIAWRNRIVAAEANPPQAARPTSQKPP